MYWGFNDLDNKIVWYCLGSRLYGVTYAAISKVIDQVRPKLMEVAN
jgi:hypothetical protein